VEILDPTLKALEEKLQASQAMQDAATTDAPAGGQ